MGLATLATNVRNPAHFRRNMLIASFTALDPKLPSAVVDLNGSEVWFPDRQIS
jgi:hypothetical protein